MRITETIHHGDYRNVRTVTLSAPAWEAFRDEVLATGPYASTGELDSNRYAREAWDGVQTGKGELGWRSFAPDTVRVSLRVTAELSPSAWEMNYGTRDEGIRADVREYVTEVTQTLLTEWIAHTGNEGSVTVTDDTEPEGMPSVDPTLAYVVTVAYTDTEGRTRERSTDGVNWAEGMYWIVRQANSAGVDITDPKPYARKHEWNLRRDGEIVGWAIAERDSREVVR